MQSLIFFFSTVDNLCHHSLYAQCIPNHSRMFLLQALLTPPLAQIKRGDCANLIALTFPSCSVSLPPLFTELSTIWKFRLKTWFQQVPGIRTPPPHTCMSAVEGSRYPPNIGIEDMFWCHPIFSRRDNEGLLGANALKKVFLPTNERVIPIRDALDQHSAYYPRIPLVLPVGFYRVVTVTARCGIFLARIIRCKT